MALRICASFLTVITSNISVSTCSRYVSPSGKYIWTSNGTYNDTIANTQGCDSIITIKLNIKEATSQTISKSVCNKYLSPSGKYIWTSTGTYQDTIANKQGCDSVITVKLSIGTSSETISRTACVSYLSPSGKYLWTNSGVFNDTIINVAGCDSFITVNLTIRKVDISVTNTSPTLKANTNGAIYQWLDCNKGYAIIDGANSQSFTATSNGSYAVKVTQNGCIDTSLCINVNNAAILENTFGVNFNVFPIPTQGEVNINLGAVYNNVRAVVRNTVGKEVMCGTYTNTRSLKLEIKGEAGLYVVELSAHDKKALFNLIKE